MGAVDRTIPIGLVDRTILNGCRSIIQNRVGKGRVILKGTSLIELISRGSSSLRGIPPSLLWSNRPWWGIVCFSPGQAAQDLESLQVLLTRCAVP